MTVDKEPEPGLRKFHKFQAPARDAYLKCMMDGQSMTEAAKSIGLDYKTIWAYRKQHPEFDVEIFEAEKASITVVESALFEQCRKGNVRAMEFYLCNRASGRWSDRRNAESRHSIAEPQEKPDQLSAVLEVLDAHPDAKAELIKRIEMTSP